MTFPLFKPKVSPFDEDYEWFLKNNMDEYSEQWVAILEKKVIAHDPDLRKLLRKVNKDFKNRKPLFTKIQSGNAAMY